VFDELRLQGCLAVRPAVLFLCTGNICRSPFAELCLKRILSERGREEVSVTSAGLLDAPGRRCPEVALNVAASLDVDMSDHQSQTVTADLLGEAGAVFVMDEEHRWSLLKRFPGVEDKLFFLGAADGTSDVEIHDPYGRNEIVFRETYQRMRDCVLVLRRMIVKHEIS
jgi:protein-tyrosine phosphatase